MIQIKNLTLKKSEVVFIYVYPLKGFSDGYGRHFGGKKNLISYSLTLLHLTVTRISPI